MVRRNLWSEDEHLGQEVVVIISQSLSHTKGISSTLIWISLVVLSVVRGLMSIFMNFVS